MARTCLQYSRSAGFTLIELVVIIVVLGIIAAVAVPKVGNLIGASKENQTKTELVELKRAIAGNPQVVAAGQYVDRGFLGDVGFVPASLQDLVQKPGSVAVYDRLSGLGWHGPYMDSLDAEYLKDAWDVNYIYDATARTIASIGSGDTIKVSF
jgi:prepilin-type N-terminal cleavage/methylation domain-containing protein